MTENTDTRSDALIAKFAEMIEKLNNKFYNIVIRVEQSLKKIIKINDTQLTK